MAAFDHDWRRESIVRFDAALRDEGELVAELYTAGVSEQRIEALYPFRWEDYRLGIEHLFRNNQRAHTEGNLVSMFDIYEKVGLELPLQETVACMSLRNTREGSEGWKNGNLPTTRRVLYANLLQIPLILRIMRRYPFGSGHWTNSASSVFEQNLPKFQEVTEKWLNLVESAARPQP